MIEKGDEIGFLQAVPGGGHVIHVVGADRIEEHPRRRLYVGGEGRSGGDILQDGLQFGEEVLAIVDGLQEDGEAVDDLEFALLHFSFGGVGNGF